MEQTVEGWPPGFLAYKQGRESLGASFFSHEECDRFQAKTPPPRPLIHEVFSAVVY